MKKTIGILLSIIIGNILIAQSGDIIEQLNKRDSLMSLKTKELSSKNQVTNEIHGILFRNIYASQNYNEEVEFQKEIDRLMPFDNKIIDTILFYQVNVFGENVYDTSSKGGKLENFLSKKVHINTKKKIIQNRYLLFEHGDVFSPYRAFENARLIRSSGIFHDVRVQPVLNSRDSSRIILIYYIQDVFPYGFSLVLNSSSNFGFGLNNVNLFGLNHKLNTMFNINTKDTIQVFGYELKYTIPNIIKKSFIDVYAQWKNYAIHKNFELGAYRQFSRPEFRWAGGNITAYNDQMVFDFNGGRVHAKQVENQAWFSYAFPFQSPNTTINSIITGLKYSYKNNIERPLVSSNLNYNYWNSHFLLYSLGYSRVKFVQDRLINGFGRTEDIPKGFSINALYGLDFNEFNTRTYYGGQLLGQYYTKQGYYINLGVKLGYFISKDQPSQGVFDFNLQNVSASYKLGNFRLRNYFNMRTTIGINHDSTDFITLNEYNGIRGAQNSNFKGNSRFTTSFQSNLFLPISLLGFRFSIFGLIEIAKIQPDFNNFFDKPLMTGLSAGVSIRNENLIFDAIQFQYGLFPSTNNLTQRGFVVSTLIPFKFQSLDISKPNTVAYE